MRKRIVWAAFVFLLLAWAAVRPSADGYDVLGVDVSHYQGEIDFEKLEEQGMSFVFIKATEGSTHVDERLAENASNVKRSLIRAGYYHFFSYDSPGASQAENFIENVPFQEGMLPPVIDVEFYGGYCIKPADSVWVETQLRAMIDVLESHYGMRPIIYCTQKAYSLYIKDRFDDCDLWIRSVYWRPLSKDWTFWQYTDRAKLEGYRGEEECIDVNVFQGTMEEFLRFPDRMEQK